MKNFTQKHIGGIDMNWKSHPQYFCNGKFEFIDQFLEKETLTGCMNYEKGIWLLNENGEEVSDVDGCKLIAKHVDNIKDHEVEIFINKYFGDAEIKSGSVFIDIFKNNVKTHLKEFCLKQKEMIWLLDMGYYIFNDNTDVIFKD